MEKNKNFIITNDIVTKDLLEKEGFKLLSSSNGNFTFLNCSNKMIFADKNIVFTNKLCI